MRFQGFKFSLIVRFDVQCCCSLVTFIVQVHSSSSLLGFMFTLIPRLMFTLIPRLIPRFQRIIFSNIQGPARSKVTTRESTSSIRSSFNISILLIFLFFSFTMMIVNCSPDLFRLLDKIVEGPLSIRVSASNAP